MTRRRFADWWGTVLGACIAGPATAALLLWSILRSAGS